jgi:hypothetical protein
MHLVELEKPLYCPLQNIKTHYIICNSYSGDTNVIYLRNTNQLKIITISIKNLIGITKLETLPKLTDTFEYINMI